MISNYNTLHGMKPAKAFIETVLAKHFAAHPRLLVKLREDEDRNRGLYNVSNGDQGFIASIAHLWKLWTNDDTLETIEFNVMSHSCRRARVIGKAGGGWQLNIQVKPLSTNIDEIFEIHTTLEKFFPEDNEHWKEFQRRQKIEDLLLTIDQAQERMEKLMKQGPHVTDEDL